MKKNFVSERHVKQYVFSLIPKSNIERDNLIEHISDRLDTFYAQEQLISLKNGGTGDIFPINKSFVISSIKEYIEEYY